MGLSDRHIKTLFILPSTYYGLIYLGGEPNNATLDPINIYIVPLRNISLLSENNTRRDVNSLNQ